MANNYTLFSFAIPLDTPEKTEWAERAIAWLKSADDEANLNRLAILQGIDAAPEGEPAPEAHEFDELLPEDFVENEYLGYSVEVDSDGIWIYSDESGTPDYAVPLIQAFLLKFDPRGCVAFEWAETCSKPRLDEFGGGAVFITATGVQYMNTGQWVTQRISEHEKATK